MTEREQINAIREEYSGLRDLPRESLKSSVKTLADDLYAKDTHFIFELIQNAEDNDYQPKILPRLRFEICQQEIGGGQEIVLSVHNNEVGFLEKNVLALCQVGQSTKNKAQGYIGEKGIGFKSVFRVTTAPYVFSNGFRFCLPERDEETGLGYIVPKWIEKRPDGIIESETTIILPLNKNKKDVQTVSKALREIAPETILFLKKLTSLEIAIHLPDEKYEVIAEKRILREIGAASKLVELSYMQSGGDSTEEVVATARYWLTEHEFKKPAEIQHEKRLGIETRTVSVAIPLDQGIHEGKLFAYLPVWEQTGLPFLINADFLLVSSREGIREDEDWNIWLRDCVAETYTAAFLSLLADHNLPQETRMSAYASIPLDSHHQFLEPIVDAIKERMAGIDCVLALPGKEFVKPEQARLCHKNIRSFFGLPDCFPPYLRKNARLVCPEIEPFSKQLEAIGVKKILPSDVMICLEDSTWVQGHPLTWFIELFRFLKTQKFSSADLCRLQIVPISQANSKKPRFSCEGEQPIYFPVDLQEREALANTPQWLSPFVVIEFLFPDFLYMFEWQADGEDLKDWMTLMLNIHPFSSTNYSVNILTTLWKFEQFTDDQLVEAARFLFQYGKLKTPDWESVPIILSDGRRMLLQEARKLTIFASGKQIEDIVVPEGYDPESGWQHIWLTEEDRAHFVALADHYVVMPETWFHILDILRYPSFRKIQWGWGKEPQGWHSEKYLADFCGQRAASSRADETYIHSYDIPTSFVRGKNNNDLSKSLLNFFKTQKEKNFDFQARGIYENHGRHRKDEDSSLLVRLRTLAWLPTTKGLAAPCTAFFEKQGTREILGDAVPYVTEDLPESILKLFHVKFEVTVDELLGLLQDHSGVVTLDNRMPLRVYTELFNRSHSNALTNDPKIRIAFANRAIIFVKDEQGEVRWRKCDECVWEDASEVLGDDFTYLKSQYPKLKDFFVEKVGVKDRVDAECFARRWIKLQDAPLPDIEKQRDVVEQILRQIKPDVVSSSRAGWWQDFFNKAKLYSQSDTFCIPNELILPDDGGLQRVFKGHDGIEFPWRPGNDGFNDWLPFYKTFDIPLLSESVTERLEQGLAWNFLAVNQFVTDAAVKMMTAWLRENRKGEYERLLDEGVFHQLLDLREANAQESIQVEFRLKTASYSYEPKIESYPVFWDRTDNNVLIYKNDVERSLIAKALAKGLLTAYKDLAHWIELVLGASSTERLRGENWSVPQEILDLCGHNKSDQTSPVNAIIQPDKKAVDELSDVVQVSSQKRDNPLTNEIPQKTHQTNEARRKDAIGDVELEEGNGRKLPLNDSMTASDDGDAENTQQNSEKDCQTEKPDSSSNGYQGAAINLSYGDELTKAFNKDGETEINGEYPEFGKNTIKDPELRGNRLGESYRKNIDEEPSPEVRRPKTERSPLEGSNEAVRSSLYEWYHGRCQICEETWPKQNGDAFFVAAYLVGRRHARWLDEPGNAICLCAKHFAQWQHAAKQESEDVISQIGKLRLKNEGGAGELSLRFRMFNEDYTISYDERHFLALRKLLEVTRGMHSSCPTG